MSKNPPRDFDLPTKHINGQTFFVPPKARNPEEIERRRSQPAGTLLAEYQCRGLAMATIIVGMMRDQEDITSASSFISPAGINVAWHSFAEASSVMRRRLKLAKLDAADPEMRPTSFMLKQDTVERFALATEKSHRLVNAVRSEDAVHAFAFSKQVAQLTGSAALLLDCIEVGDKIGYGELVMTDYELQMYARSRSMNVLERARNLHTLTGESPTLAGLADPDSGLSVYLRKTATNAVAEAYEQAYESTQLATAV